MRQLLMLGFYCEIYRRQPLCRLYVNDVLVDEFNIPHTPRKDTFIYEKILDPEFWTLMQYQLQVNPPFIKFLELDNAGVRSLDLRVEIQNNDNNYANGFVTQHTRVMLCQCWLAPVKVLEQFDQIKNRWKYSMHNWHRWHSYTNYTSYTESIAKYYSGWRNYVLDNLAAYADMYFPGIDQQPQSIEQLKSLYSNYQDLPHLSQNSAMTHWIGSSGYFHITLTKKLGFWRPSTDRRRGWQKLSHIHNVMDLHNKYKNYEDTRSINQ